MATKLGKAMRAVKLDTEAAALQGINTTKIYALAMATGCALAGLAGGIIAPSFQSPPYGPFHASQIVHVLIVGGLESMLGGVVGGLVIGMTLSFGYYFFGGLSEILLFVVIGSYSYLNQAEFLVRSSRMFNTAGKKAQVITAAIIIAVGLLIPFFITSSYQLHLIIMLFINVVLAMSFSMLISTGLITIGAASFWAIGAYTSAILVLNYDLSFWIALPWQRSSQVS